MAITRFNFMLFTLFCIIFPTSHAAKISTHVPFEMITLNPGDNLQASYSFGPYVMIFCFDNTVEPIANIQWPYKGQTYSSVLPVVLKTNAAFEGQFADPNGTISITNTTSQPMVVNCQFGY